MLEEMKQKTVVEMKMDRKRTRGISGRNGVLTGRDGKVSARRATPHTETAAEGKKMI